MSINIRVINGSISERFKRRFESIPTRLRNKLQDLKAQIQTRASSGRGPEGEALKKYSPEYKAFKEESGRRGDVVDFTFSGDMWRGLLTAVRRDGLDVLAEIFFRADQAEKAAQNQKRRYFFALSQAQREEIETLIREIINGR